MPMTAMRSIRSAGWPATGRRNKRIIYRRNADRTLMARIEGESNGKSFAKDWHYLSQKK